ncbi:MAG: DUF1176 domain-containing protein [Synechococcus sp.]|nr:DUF1176 domain-containing protein [Synechococcus sp.]
MKTPLVKFSLISIYLILSLSFLLSSCQNQSEEEVTTPQTPVENSQSDTEEPIPVPAEPLPLAGSRPTDADENPEAIATNYTTPDFSAEIVPELIKNQTILGICQGFRFDPELTKVASNVYRVGANSYLVHLVCGSTAYQLLQEYFLYQKVDNQPDLTALPIAYFSRDSAGQLIEETDKTMAGYSEYDPITQTISIFTKARGLGDCGSLGFYRFTGTALQLERFLLKDVCDEKYIEPINYPQVYP